MYLLLLHQILQDWCSEHCTSVEVGESENVGKCLQKGFPVSCADSAGDVAFKTSRLTQRKVFV